MKIQSGILKTMKTNLELYRVVMGGYRWLQETPRRKWWFFVTHKQTLHHNIYIVVIKFVSFFMDITIIITIVILILRPMWKIFIFVQYQMWFVPGVPGLDRHGDMSGMYGWMDSRSPDDWLSSWWWSDHVNWQIIASQAYGLSFLMKYTLLHRAPFLRHVLKGKKHCQ